DQLWTRPLVEIADAARDRHKQHRQERECSHAGFEQAPDQEAPGSTGEVVEHQDGETAKGDSEIELVGCEIRAEKLLRTERSANNAYEQGHDSDSQGPPLPAIQLGSLCGRDGAHGSCPPGLAPAAFFFNSARISSDNSLAGKCWLNCKARMYAIIAQ